MPQTTIKSAKTIVSKVLAEVATVSVEEALLIAVSGDHIFVDLRAEKHVQ